MHTLYVRNLPDDLYTKLRKLAAARRRSMSAEVVNLIEQALRREEEIQQRSRALDRIAERRAKYDTSSETVDSLTLLREDRDR